MPASLPHPTAIEQNDYGGTRTHLNAHAIPNDAEYRSMNTPRVTYESRRKVNTSSRPFSGSRRTNRN